MNTDLLLLRKGHRMCGVTGILNFNKAPVVEKQLKAMTDVIAHRRPDGEGQWLKSYVGLGHRRLSIIDLSLMIESNPMKSLRVYCDEFILHT